MGQVSVTINSRTYRLACEEGDVVFRFSRDLPCKRQVGNEHAKAEFASTVEVGHSVNDQVPGPHGDAEAFIDKPGQIWATTYQWL